MLVKPGFADEKPPVPDPQTTPELSPDFAALEVWKRNHFLAFDNLSIGYQSDPPFMLLNASTRSQGTVTVERLLNNRPGKKGVQMQDLIVFKSGKVRGTGLLIERLNSSRELQFKMWLPALRKIRRLAAPDPDDIWGGSYLTYADLYLRQPQDEHHLWMDHFSDISDCLLDIEQFENFEFTEGYSRSPHCGLSGKKLAVLKSIPTIASSGYDYRLRWIDLQTLVEYQVEYYFDNRLVKRFQKSWHQPEKNLQQGQLLRYWTVLQFAEDNGYGKINGKSLAIAGENSYRWNQDFPKSTWTEQSLRKIKR